MLKIELLALGILRRDGKIVMVRQEAADGSSYWVLPGGLVESGELVSDALAREVAEEAGVAISGEHALAYASQIDRPGTPSQVVAFVFEVGGWTGELGPRDPDGEVLEAALVSPEEALERIDLLFWRGMREPLRAYLSGAAGRGGLWCYREFGGVGDQRLVARIG